MALPIVAIVGRPNVGKSSLFNWLTGKRISIVDPTAGVTRDRVSYMVEASGRFFELFDTGGIGIVDSDELSADVERQINTAIDVADVILFVTDARTGIVALDEVVVEQLRQLKKPIICVVNKCDTEVIESNAYDFHRFGFDPVVPVSAEQDRGAYDLLEAILAKLPPDTEESPSDVSLKLAIVGKRNAGKSTFINALAEEDRVIVSEIPGTTRDSVDVRFERDGKTIIAIDTAGVRHKSSLANSIEFYSMARAERSIRRADVVMMFFDATVPIGRIDKQLTGYILDHMKPAIFVFNKWDLVVNQVSSEEFGDYTSKMFPMLDYVPLAFITAKEGKNVHRLLNLAQHLHKQAQMRVTTGELNRVLRAAIEQNPPAQKAKRQPKIYFASQVAVQPPTIVLFTNGPDLFDEPYQRYLLGYFRKHLPFAEVPIKLDFRHRSTIAGKGNKMPAMDDVFSTKAEKETAAGTESKKKPRPPKKSKKSELWDV
ncbi:MAG: ribosome biogenesis GTPase Der [Zavarzinella sp.]